MNIDEYFEIIKKQTFSDYELANNLRKLGLDPEENVEIHLASNLAERVEKLLIDYDVEGVSKIIDRYLKTKNREETAIEVAIEIVKSFEGNKEKLIEKALRVSLAILTEGILIAPIDGISHVEIVTNPDGTNHLAVYYAGPIRAAGGTGQALTILIADILRQHLNIGKYKATTEEIERYKEEIPLYRQIPGRHLQYFPTPEEIENIIKNIPICIDGTKTENVEVTGYRDLKRVKTNGVRGGACLVIAEGLCLKASKIMKYVKKLNMQGWDFLEYFSNKKDDESAAKKAMKYLKEGIIAGRPIISYPNRPGGFVLRYGRCRNTGIAAVGINPATMYILESFIVSGTQIKIEKPGKAGAIVSCDSIEGPTVLLNDGSVKRISKEEEYIPIKGKIKKTLNLGEILISFGEFLENNYPLSPGAYTIERYLLELSLANATKNDLELALYTNNFDEAYELSKKYNVPLHPIFNLFWHDLSTKEISLLSKWCEKNSYIQNQKIWLKGEESIFNILQTLCIPYTVIDNKIEFTYDDGKALLYPLGLIIDKGSIIRRKNLNEDYKNPIEYVSYLSEIKIMPKGPTRIGTRMGRPEKADVRDMQKITSIFPGETKKGERKERVVELNKRICPQCHKETYEYKCPSCHLHTISTKEKKAYTINLSDIIKEAKNKLNISSTAIDIKLVSGLISENAVPENIEKGILRAKYQTYVFKDGTIRYDMINLPLTHFKPREIGTSIQKLKILGYDKDILGNPINEDSLIELFPHDVILPISAGDYLVRVAQFIDEELKKIYNVNAVYNAQSKEDLIGALIIGLAPHTSGGVVGRIIGYSSIDSCYAHPFFHSAKRRNCDGDEDGIMLLLDAFLNFSKDYLPSSNGGFMDAPLVLTYRIDPSEVDKEVENLDLMPIYPLELYMAADRGASPKEVEPLIDNVSKRLKTNFKYSNLGFTHDVSNISVGPHTSAYKSDSTIFEKASKSISLMSKLRSVDVDNAVSLMIEHHLIKDFIANLYSFYRQEFRCKSCNEKYRRIPLSGRCRNIVNGSICDGEIIPNININMVTKYVDMIKELSTKYKLPPYLKSRMDIINEYALNFSGKYSIEIYEKKDNVK